MKSSGIAAIRSPKKSRICVLAMSTAMPLVKPTTTGRGMYLIGGSDAGRAERNEDDARHHRAQEQAVDAVLPDDAGHDHDERAGGAADGVIDPPSAEVRNPATIAQ